MRFGVYSSIADPPAGEDIARCVEEVLEEAQSAEEFGFDSYFFGEHHQDKDGFLPSPLIVATAVAARTSTLNVGTSVILLPLHHPVRLAEDVITLDQVSRGRVILGVGIGYQPADFRAFDVPIEDRTSLFEEGIDVIRRCWTGEPFTFHGDHYHLEDVQVRPAPYQRPSPPLWIGASTLPGARRAGRLADAFIAGPSTNMRNTLRLVKAYREAAATAGRQPQVVLMRDAWVAETRQQAEEIYGPEVLDAYKYYWRNGLAEFKTFTSESEFSIENIAPDRLILGDPEECAAEFHRWSEAIGADYFHLRLRHAHSGGPPHERIMAEIKLFGQEVIPRCR
jgi:probable F420-dependent oxidoreductase